MRQKDRHPCITVMTSAQEYTQDITSLENEISLLEIQFQQLSEQRNVLLKDIHILESGSLRTVSPATDPEIPKLAVHEYFDESISTFFRNLPKPKAATKKAKNDASGLREKVILENVYRLYGITAFPVNDSNPDTPKHSVDDSMMGIRFDLFDRMESRFLVPHYIILKRKPKNNEWMVFKTTLPAYIPLQSLSDQWLNVDLEKFVKEIRRHLVCVQNRRQLFAKIQVRLQEMGGKLESDLNCSKVKITLQSKITINLTCSPSAVTNVTVSDPQNNLETILAYKIALKCKLCNLEQKLFGVVR